MQGKSREELYRQFLAAIENEAQSERRAVNRRMLSVFFWCFVVPAITCIALLVLIRFQILPHRARLWQEPIILLFPVAYTVYFLGIEVLRDLPNAFRRGGIAAVLRNADSESRWRRRVADSLRRSVDARAEDWRWLVTSFEFDLERLQYRARYMTALAGAVFYLIMQGIDALGPEEKVTYMNDSVLGWIQTNSSDMSQFVGLALFLVLLYLSASQSHQFLRRFLHCAVLLRDSDNHAG
jgi:hypothetical protein